MLLVIHSSWLKPSPQGSYTLLLKFLPHVITAISAWMCPSHGNTWGVTRVFSSSRDALRWCRGHLWLRCTGRRPLRLHLLLRRGGRVLLLLVLLLLLMQATMQSL
jgi:hypothetical protein